MRIGSAVCTEDIATGAACSVEMKKERLSRRRARRPYSVEGEKKVGATALLDCDVT